MNNIDASHFNGGTITWFPVYPSSNSSSILITVTQSYSWVYPTVPCQTSIPSTSNGTKLTCIANCTTQNNNSAQGISVLTDCTSYSTSLNMTLSQRSVNITLTENTYFWIAFQGKAWRTLANAATGGGGGAGWSIASLINLQRRSDGLINTPPVAQITSPQFVIVNKTTAINIPVSDVNTGDDIRCRFSQKNSIYGANECDDVCTATNTTGLKISSNCTLTFTATTSGVWYAISLQVEDFINTTSTYPMSSVSVQFLIYVLPLPTCTRAPVIVPLTGCLEVQANVLTNFTLYVMNYCNTTKITITDLFATVVISGMDISSLVNSTTNTSLSYITLTWAPQSNQLGSQQFCAVAYTSENVQSDQYCVTFVVTTSKPCTTTTTSTTSTTTSSTTSTTSTTSTSSTTTTTTTSTTSTTSSTTSSTSSTTSVTTTTKTTSTTSTSTSSTTSTTSSTTSSTSSTTSTTTTTETTTTTSTSTTSTSTSSTTSTTSSSTSSTSSTTSITTTTSSTTSTSTTSTTSSKSSSTSSTTSTTTTTSSTTSTSTTSTTSVTTTTSSTTSTTTTTTTTSTTSTSTTTTTSSTSSTSTSTTTTSTSSTSTSTSSTTSATTTTSTTSTSTSITSATTTTATTTTTTSVTTVTETTTINTKSKDYNIPLIVGLSLLALLLALGCCCLWLYLLRWRPSARRRLQYGKRNQFGQQSDILSHGKDLTKPQSVKHVHKLLKSCKFNNQQNLTNLSPNDHIDEISLVNNGNRRTNNGNVPVKKETDTPIESNEQIVSEKKKSKLRSSSVSVKLVKKSASSSQIPTENNLCSESPNGPQVVKIPRNQISASLKSLSNHQTNENNNDSAIYYSIADISDANPSIHADNHINVSLNTSRSEKNPDDIKSNRASTFRSILVNKIKPTNENKKTSSNYPKSAVSSKSNISEKSSANSRVTVTKISKLHS